MTDKIERGAQRKREEFAYAVCGAKNPDGSYILNERARRPCTRIHTLLKESKSPFSSVTVSTSATCAEVGCPCWTPAILLPDGREDVGLLIELLEEADYRVGYFSSLSHGLSGGRWWVHKAGLRGVGEGQTLLEAAAKMLGVEVTDAA